MKLTQENYHSIESNKKYMSVSQYKTFAGSRGEKPCEAKAMAKINGEYVFKASKDMMIGSYVDAYVEGTLGKFREAHPEIFSTRKPFGLLAPFRLAEQIIERIEKDEKFMQTLSGEKQRIFTFEMFGVQWKIMLDSLIAGVAITDLKVINDLKKRFWHNGRGWVGFIEHYGYMLQGAVYNKGVEICTGEDLPFYLSVADKKDMNIAIIGGFEKEEFENIILEIGRNMPRILQVKNGEVEPIRCECCDFCAPSKVLTGPIHYSVLLED